MKATVHRKAYFNAAIVYLYENGVMRKILQYLENAAISIIMA